MDRVVLGAGPTGLIAAYLLETDVVVAERFGSGIRRFTPTFLRRTPATEVLLDELSVPFSPRTIRFGYLGDVGVSTEFSSDDHLEYFRRSRGLEPGAPVEVPSSAALSVTGEIETFDVSVDDLVSALAHHVQVFYGKISVVEICRTDGRTIPKIRIAVVGGREFWTRQLVNTLPAPVFEAVVRHEDAHLRAAKREWSAVEKTFVRVPIAAVSAELRRARDELELAYVHVVSSDRVRFAYDGVTFLDDVAVFEFNRTAIPTGGTWDALERFSARIQIDGPSRDSVEYGGTVWHLGRFARWRNEIFLDDVVEEIYGYLDD